MPWTIKASDADVIQMQATSILEGLHIDRTTSIAENDAVYAVKEVVQNINLLGRMFNMVQHPTLAAPFLEETTVVK